jgi:enterochelin esterase-like enzyme
MIVGDWLGSASRPAPARPRPQATRRPARRVVTPGHFERWGPYEIPGIGTRGVRVYLPYGLPEPGAERSVVVLLDGQNVFDDEGSFAGGWRAHRAADEVVTRKRAAPIVVGVDHGYGERLRDYSPFPVLGARGALDDLAAFLRDRLCRDLRLRFELDPHPRHWVIGGASLGGLAALYTHFVVPEVFGGALCLSPSFGLGGRRFRDLLASHPLPWTSRIYIDMGAGEGRGIAPRVAEAVVRVLRARGYGEDRLRWRRIRGGGHSEWSWRRRLPGALRFLLR